MAHNLPFENRNGTIYISTAARQQIQFSAAETESLEKDNLKLRQLKLCGYLCVKKCVLWTFQGSHPCQNVTKLWTLSVPPLGTPVLPNLDEFTEKLKRPLTTVFFGMGNT